MSMGTSGGPFPGHCQVWARWFFDLWAVVIAHGCGALFVGAELLFMGTGLLIVGGGACLCG